MILVISFIDIRPEILGQGPSHLHWPLCSTGTYFMNGKINLRIWNQNVKSLKKYVLAFCPMYQLVIVLPACHDDDDDDRGGAGGSGATNSFLALTSGMKFWRKGIVYYYTSTSGLDWYLINPPSRQHQQRTKDKVDCGRNWTQIAKRSEMLLNIYFFPQHAEDSLSNIHIHTAWNLGKAITDYINLFAIDTSLLLF